jgi:hypothetical protein
MHGSLHAKVADFQVLPVKGFPIVGENACRLEVTGAGGAAVEVNVTTGSVTVDQGDSFEIAFTTVNTGAAYAAGDVLGAKMELASAVRAAAGKGTLCGLTLINKSGVALACRVYFFNADPAAGTYTDNGAFSLHDTDALLLVAVATISAGDWVNNGASYSAFVSGPLLFKPFKLASGTSLYAIVVSTDAGTWGTNDVQGRLGLLRD